MGKRSRKDALPDDSTSGAVTQISKRAKSDTSWPGEPAVDLLLEHADELIDCLRCLKSETSQRGGQSNAASSPGSESSLDRLNKLSATLLPAFRALADKASEEITLPVSKTQVKTGLPVPPPTIVTKWTTADAPKSQPPLPEVLDPQLEKAALTHTGQHQKGLNYERLEWLGDAYLEVIATALVHQTFPDFPEGKCAQVREIMVRNATLCNFTTMYGLEKRASLPQEFSAGGRVGGTSASDKQRVKTLGDLFEAYVGAVVLSDPNDGVKRVSDWLKALWSPILEQQIKQKTKRPADDDLSAKTKLETLIGGRGIKIEYKDLPSQKKHRDHNLPLFSVACVLHGWGESGKQLGYGSALGKKEAGQKAAQMALDNKKLLKPYIEKKAAYDAARLAQQQQEAQAS